MLTKRAVVGLLVVAALLAGTAREARAATSRGTLITNISSATFSTQAVGGFPLEVSYAATAYVLVEAPYLIIWKNASPTKQVAGGCVTFKLWLWNDSTMMTAYNVTYFDQLPDNMSYNDAYASWNGGSGGTWFPSASADNITYAAGEPTVGQDAPYYMKWVLTQLGPRKSAFVEFSACIL
ncbi:MAG: hypothetical protein IH999_04755 [Proteobacteria bacterium]|nr:hypothetical protein [Pseudomonadota bacterium]